MMRPRKEDAMSKSQKPVAKPAKAAKPVAKAKPAAKTAKKK
jgi:hypothetical protein